MLVDDLIAHLYCEYDFDNEKFNDYAHSRVTKYNKTLMGELDCLIKMIKSHANTLIELTDKYIGDDFENEVSSILKQIDYEKQYVTNKGESDEGVNMLKEGDYLALLDSLKDSSILYLESCRNYVEIKEKLLGLMNSPDGFLNSKESHYEFTNNEIGLATSKEDYIASRPSYDVSECKFIESN
jgi:tryptophanyl-tRNA synthetase